MSVLWSVDAMVAAMGADRAGALPAGISGISIDSRTLSRGDAFFAIQGDNRDLLVTELKKRGHDAKKAGG